MQPIPAPSGYPLIGNVLEVDAKHPNESLARIAKINGPIFRLRLPKEKIFVGNYTLAKTCFDETKFQKAVTGPLGEVRNIGGDGLFTAFPGEPNWELAHRTLMPAFGPLPIRDMFPEMQDIVSQLVLKWGREGSDARIHVTDDFTRLTLDSIAICAMGARFNSFYHEHQHPFVDSMVRTLATSFSRSRRLPVGEFWYRTEDEQYFKDIASMEKVSRDLVNARREHPAEKNDLLNAMLKNKDPKTGASLSDETVIRNMITFLIAGHETTSGLLSFLFYELLQNPDAYRQATAEVDSVVGKETITVGHMSKFPYIEACLRETLRLHPTAPAFTVQSKGDQVLGGKYLVKDGEYVTIMLSQLHRDPEVYGQDAEEFKPSRMLFDDFQKLPPGAWKPFGNGIRACIGRPFAWQEAILATASLLQAFHFVKADPGYTLQIKTTLTIKPDGFFMRAQLRDEGYLDTARHPVQLKESAAKGHQPASATKSNAEDKKPLLVLYGSNTGTCEGLANTIQASAAAQGFNAEVKSLDSAGTQLPQGPVLIITASYEGQPPDNAGHFYEWVTSEQSSKLTGTKYAVFGVGNKEWVNTYQKVPSVIDDSLSRNGAERLVPRAASDVTKDNIFDVFEEWQKTTFWPAVRAASGISTMIDDGDAVTKGLRIELDTTMRANQLRQDVRFGKVVETRLLTAEGKPRKRHIGIQLPTGLSYSAGDYLAILPMNHDDVVKRVIRRFQLPWDAVITIDQSEATTLPKGQKLGVHDLLSSMVELAQPVTSRAVEVVIGSIADEKQLADLKSRSAADLQRSNTSLLELLEEYDTSTLTFGQFLAALPAMRTRQYSISSSPLDDASICTLTYSVIDAPAKSGHGRRYYGTCSTYLEQLRPGDLLSVSLRKSRTGFHPPQDPKVPMILACAGTGLAPFRAFVSERAIKKAAGQEVGPALLFYGLNGPDEDDLYREQFDEWQKAGVVDVRRAFTFAPEKSGGCKFVQERILLDKDDATKLFRDGAQVYVCGAGIVGTGIEKAIARIHAEISGDSEEDSIKWARGLKESRYWADVFA